MNQLADGMGTILPSQFYSDRVRTLDPGIRRLLCTMLADAIDIYRSGKHRDRRAFVEVKSWLQEDGNVGSPFSFINICEALGIEPHGARTAISKWLGDGSLPSAGAKIARRSPVMITSRLRSTLR
jgi:hypothetical protein